ncbi:MAG: hypothetical protein ABH842_01840 [Candidatus Micrarchaeota archaeon]
MAIHLDPRKVPADHAIRLNARGVRDRLQYFQRMFLTAPDDFNRALVCCAAFDMGFKDFARANNPVLVHPNQEIFEKLVQIAKSVVGTSASVDFQVALHTMPLRNDGILYPRDGIVVRIEFSDGKSAYCKSRNAGQEAIGIDLEGLTGLPNYRYKRYQDWIITEGVEGYSLFDYTFFQSHGFNSTRNGRELFARIIAITAFDYVFGLLDRNEGGIIFKPEAKPTAIDHEYLLNNPPRILPTN